MVELVVVEEVEVVLDVVEGVPTTDGGRTVVVVVVVPGIVVPGIVVPAAI